MQFINNAVGMDFRTAPVGWFSFTTQNYEQGALNFVVPTGDDPSHALETTSNTVLTLTPGQHFQFRTVYLLDRLRDPESHSAIYNNDIFREEIFYQHDPRLGVRVIPQYTVLLANPQFTSLRSSRQLNADLLVTYLVHPGTALYLGYNSDLEAVTPGLCTPLSGSQICSPNQWRLGPLRNDSRQLFFKLSYQLNR